MERLSATRWPPRAAHHASDTLPTPNPSRSAEAGGHGETKAAAQIWNRAEDFVPEIERMK